MEGPIQDIMLCKILKVFSSSKCTTGPMYGKRANTWNSSTERSMRWGV